MNYLNITLPDNKVLTVGYSRENDSNAIVFENDIQVNDWTISRIIQVGGPRYSTYKYNWDYYLEFVITDMSGAQRVRRYHYNGGNHNDNVGVFASGTSQVESIAYFIKVSPIFISVDWDDFEAYMILTNVQRILDSKMTSIAKVEKLRNVL